MNEFCLLSGRRGDFLTSFEQSYIRETPLGFRCRVRLRASSNQYLRITTKVAPATFVVMRRY